MIETAIVMVGIVVCTFVLSKANISITVNHTHKDFTPQPAQRTMSEEEIQKLMDEQSKVLTFDDAVKAVQDAIGGALDV